MDINYVINNNSCIVEEPVGSYQDLYRPSKKLDENMLYPKG